MSDAAQEELVEVVQDPEGQLGVAEEQAEEAAEDVDQEAVVEVAQADAASEAWVDKQWLRIAMRVTAGESAAEAWSGEVFGTDPPAEEVMAAGIADAFARMARTLLTGVQYDIEPEGGQQARQAQRAQ